MSNHWWLKCLNVFWWLDLESVDLCSHLGPCEHRQMERRDADADSFSFFFFCLRRQPLLFFGSRGTCVCESVCECVFNREASGAESLIIQCVLSGSVTLRPHVQPRRTSLASACPNTPWNYGALQPLWSKWLISHHLFCVSKPLSISKSSHHQ